MPRIRLTGEDREISLPSNMLDLLETLGIDSTAVAVERNRSIVPRRDYAETDLADRDEIEIVTLVGGG